MNIQIGVGVKKVGGVLTAYNLLPTESRMVNANLPAALKSRVTTFDYLQTKVELANPGTINQLTSQMPEGIGHLLLSRGDKIELLSIPEIDSLAKTGIDEAAMVAQLQP